MQPNLLTPRIGQLGIDADPMVGENSTDWKNNYTSSYEFLAKIASRKWS